MTPLPKFRRILRSRSFLHRLSPISASLPSASLSVLLVASCAPSKEPAAPTAAKSAEPLSVHDYLPLKDKTVSSFEMISDQGDEGMLMLEIFRPREDHVELTIAGRTQRLVIEDRRVSHMAGGIVLEEPLDVGHRFVGSFGETTITETNVSMALPAGSFDHCLTTVEESTRPPKRSTSTFCPQVGLVHMIVETFGAEGVRLETKLRHHGPRIDIRDERSLEALETTP